MLGEMLSLRGIWRHFWLSQFQGGDTCIQWVEAMDAAKYPIRCRSAPTAKYYLDKNACGAKVEKLQSKLMGINQDIDFAYAIE